MTDVSVPAPEVFRTRDLKGWDVVGRAGDKVGSVADLLIDRTGRIRYLHVEYGFPRKHLLLPQDRLEWGEGRLILGDWTKDQVQSLPPYDPDRALDAALLAELERAYPWMYGDQAEEWSQPPGETRIVPLSEAKNFKLESGAPDLRGWNVFGSDGERLGTVHQLLVDPAALKVRYVDVDLYDDLFQLKDDRHVLVPLELVELKERGNDAWVQGLTAADVARLPGYTGGPVLPAMERAVERAFAR